MMFNANFSKPEKYSLALILLISLWHLLLAGRVNLSVDEAHYALYGAHLALSYFDHPPLVGWLNALVVPFTHSDLGLRIIPIVFFAISNWLLYRIACRLYPNLPWVGFWTLALIHSALMFNLLSLSMLPDTPLMVAALMVFWTMLNLREDAQLKQWLLLGFWIGIAGLAKYTAVTLVISLLIILIIEKRFVWLTQKGLWLAILVAGLMISPVLVWNAQNDWVSILYQLNHGTHNADWSWLRVVQTQVAQFFVYSPFLYVMGVYFAIISFTKDTSNRLLAAFALPTLVLFAMGSGYEMSLPHWTQLAWLFIAPAVVAWGLQNWHKKAIKISIFVSSTLSLILVMALNSQILTPWMPLEKNQNPVQELHGWPEAIAKAQELQKSFPNSALFAANWTQASRIAWYAYPQPAYVTDNRFDQFDIWYGNPKTGSNGIVILPSYEATQPKTGGKGQFTSCLKLEQLNIENDSTIVTQYQFFYCENFQAVEYSGWAKALDLVQQTEQNQSEPFTK